MKRPSKHLILLIFAIGLLTVQGALLVRKIMVDQPNLGRRRAQIEGHTLGQILTKKNQLRTRPLGSLTWYDTAETDPIYPRDTLMVGPESRAKLKLVGGVELTLEAESLVTFPDWDTAKSGNAFLFEVKQGKIQVRSVGEPIKVRLKGKEVELKRNTRAELEISPLSKPNKVKVKKGSLVLLSNDEAQKSIQIKEGEGAEVGEEKPPEKFKVPLEITPVFPQAQSTLESRNPWLEVDFLWKGERAHTVEVSQFESFFESRSYATNTNVLKLKLALGTYYWRLLAGKRSSPVFRFHIKPERKVASRQLPNPAPTRKPTLNRKKRQKPNRNVRSRPKTEQTRSPAPTPSTYSLAPTEQKSEDLAARLTPPKKMKTEVRGYRKPTADKIPRAQAVTIKFDWERVPSAVGYVIQVSDSTNFGQTLHEFEADSTLSELSLVLEPERPYYWRVGARDIQGRIGSWSEPSKIDTSRFFKQP